MLLAVLTWQLGQLRTQVESAELQRQQLAAQVSAKQAENDSLQASIDRGGSLEEMLRTSTPRWLMERVAEAISNE